MMSMPGLDHLRCEMVQRCPFTAQAATNVLRTINTIAGGLGLDDDADNDRSDEMAGVA